MAKLQTDHHPLVHLQGTIGNQAVQRMLQTKLTINKPEDAYEQEAERVADRVMRMPAPQLQRACGCGEGFPESVAEHSGQENRRVQTKSVRQGDLGQTIVPPNVHQVLASPGQPLDATSRAFFEPRFGRDFSDVRVHSGQDAEESAWDLSARAYTVGPDIVFGAGQFTPGSHEGQKLLAHELTHVAQQVPGIGELSFQPSQTTAPVIQRKILLTGTDEDTRGQFMKKVNEDSAVTFKTEKDGSIVPANSKAKSKDVYTKVIMDAINDSQTISLRLTPKSDKVFVDDFASGEVDTADILKLPTDLFHNDLVHILTERFSVKDYEKIRGNYDIDVFSHAHNIAIRMEEKFLKEIYPKKKIEYNGSHFDESSRKVDKNGNGTIIYFHDFTDVKKVFVQPVVKGEPVENVIKAYIEVVK